ncbi:hypothetical protein F5B22DRAFT_255874 [Xylaria bambusicola]|uniref:uncharacterized protein n=1 Tax=Xylaria bambusicola TaxID=326684 RepID=UPI0020072E09|nr:uncharacterized protein F5B22DRAFT_255874 [Xylaria bambusicola]KAI0525831.1 hypothetical protein F5B22DRAFT_255874 [Xylaria bambusicola]
MLLFIFVYLTMGVLGIPGLDISAAGTVNLEVEIGTRTSPLDDHWLSPSPTTTSQAATSLPHTGDPSSHASSPPLISTEPSVQTITKTISQITLVTTTAQLCTPLPGTAPPVTSSPKTSLLGTTPTHSTWNNTASFRSFKMGTLPIPSPTTSSGRNSTVSLRTGTPLSLSFNTPASAGSTVSFKTGTTPILSPTVSTGPGKNALVQQVWSLFAVTAVAFGFMCL